MDHANLWRKFKDVRIRDAQYMTFSNFVIDVILWRNFDDPWRKLTVIDHEIFCSGISNFKASRLKDPYSFSNHAQSDNEDFLCASGSLFAICTCPPISSACIFLFPLLDITLFSNDLFDVSR
jgi:hypothetical protein